MKSALSAGLFVLNTLFWAPLIYPFAILKWLLPFPMVRRWTTKIMVGIAEMWTVCNNFNMDITQNIRWDVEGLEGLRKDKSYLVCANHQSWMDIVILQKVFNKKIPFFRFFLKYELIYVPLLGLAWWALDFPFMRRHSPEYLSKHPEKRGEDLKTTRKACARFKGNPVSIINFMEGTRFSQEKHDKQKSPYQNLLVPKSGGIAFVLSSMREQLDSFLDVTIFYPEGAVSLGAAFKGKLPVVVVRVREIPIPNGFFNESYLENKNFRGDFKVWIREIWESKDRLLSQLKDSYQK